MGKILKWANKSKMKINDGKNKTLLISTKPAEYKWNPEFKLNWKDVDPNNNYKFFGIKFDNELRFTESLSDSIQKCKTKVNIIRCLETKYWGQSLEFQHKTNTTYTISCLEYASSSWWPWISHTAKTRLETDIKPLAVRMQKKYEILKDKYQRLPEKKTPQRDD